MGLQHRTPVNLKQYIRCFIFQTRIIVIVISTIYMCQNRQLLFVEGHYIHQETVRFEPSVAHVLILSSWRGL